MKKYNDVYVLNMECFNVDTNKTYNETVGVFSNEERAIKMGKFLINATKVECFFNDKNEKIIYKKYNVENFLVL